MATSSAARDVDRIDVEDRSSVKAGKSRIDDAAVDSRAEAEQSALTISGLTSVATIPSKATPESPSHSEQSQSSVSVPLKPQKQKSPSSLASSKTSATDRRTQPSTPVLVNSASRSSSRAMHIPLTSPRSRPSLRPKNQIPRSPSPASFSFSSIFSSLSDDAEAQADIDAIAEICGRSRLSLANEYGAHRQPVGPGADVTEPEVQIIHADEADEGYGTGTGTVIAAAALETVDEASATSESEIARMGEGVNSISGAGRSQSASVVSEEADSGNLGFMRVWERGARLGRDQTSRSVVALSHAGFADRAEGFGASPDEADDSGNGSAESRAVRQLMRVVGGR